MSIYRGAGGAGDAVADSSSEALLIRELVAGTQEDADAAAASATAASNSATNAANSATLAASYTPSQTGNSGKYLKTNGTATSWDAIEINTADITGTLPIANGGTGATTLAGANIPVTDVANTFIGLQTFAGTASNADIKTSNIIETATVSATAATGTINYDITTQSVLYYTTNASANFTVNFRGSSGTTLNTLMATGESMSATFMVTNGATAYYNSAVQIDGSSVTPKWQGGTAPTSGNASAIDIYNYVIIKTGASTYTVLASVTKFA